MPGSAFAVHQEVFKKTGGMDESLGTYWDDVDWSMRAKKLGFKLELDRDWRVRHHIGKTCHQNPLYSIYYFQRNRKKIAWKYTPNLLKPVLVANLANSWLLLGFNLVRKGRFRDLKHLHRAVVD